MSARTVPQIIRIATAAALASAIVYSAAARAAPGTLADVPLFTASNVQPNIFFVLDDSGSMRLEILKSTDANREHEAQTISLINPQFPSFDLQIALFLLYGLPTTCSGDPPLHPSCTVPFYESESRFPESWPTRPPWRDDHTLELCAGYNVLAYDPTVTYTPWSGTDVDGRAYVDRAPPLKACKDPYYPSTCDVDLSDQFYFAWTDKNGNGTYETGENKDERECPRPFIDGDIKTIDDTPITNGFRLPTDPMERPETAAIDRAECMTIAGCVAPSANGEAANYANWYSYYRSRDLVLKRVVSEIIEGADTRMGLATLHNSSSAVTGDYSSDCCDREQRGANPADCEAAPTMGIADMTVTANKQGLLDSLFTSCSTGTQVAAGTPLRRALDQAGLYFDTTDSKYHEYLDDYLNDSVSSPIVSQAQGGECQQNFTILVSDGFWNGDWPADGSGTVIEDELGQTLGSYGNEDSNDSSSWDGPPHADSYTDTLADIAMHFYEKDLSTTLNNYVQAGKDSVDDNDQQHLVVFTVAFGVDGTLDPETAPAPADHTGTYAWPQPVADTQTTVDDLYHAAYNSRGDFWSAKKPGEAISALKEAVANIAANQGGSASSVGFNSTSLSDGSVVYQAQLDTGDWSGNLLAYEIVPNDATANPDDVTVGDSAWGTTGATDNGAAELLDDKPPSERVILTRGLLADGTTLDGVAFAWDNLTAAQKDDLRKGSIADGSTAQADAYGEKRLDYLRGDRSCEAGCGVDADGNGTDDDTLTLRTRGSRLGDIVGSGPLVVGAPALGWPSAGTTLFPTATNETYADFKTGTAASRTQIVYVGANDGMLHGFATEDDVLNGVPVRGGEEVIAYIPSVLFSDEVSKGLHYLSDPNYGHRFYVDRTPAITDAYTAAATTGNEAAKAWRTVAVGALGAGGRGLYALDITDPGDFNATNAADIVLWEFTSSDDAELGYTLSQPTITPVNVTDSSTGLARWAAIVGSGYNDGTGTTNPGTDQAHLFIIFLDGGLDGTWTENTDYVKLEATVNPLNELNGLSSPMLADLDGNGTADRVYVGDLVGNLWTFDLRDDTISEWQSANASPIPLFTATDGESPANPQPITVKPQISKHPSEGDTVDNWPNVMVYFGTGQFLTAADHASMLTQTFYGVWDSGTDSLDRDDLQPQGFVAGSNYQVLEENTVEWTASPQEYGWLIDLPDSDLGERVVTDATIRGDVVYFNSMIPPTGSELCTGGGSGYLYAVDIKNGGRPEAPPFDTNADGIVDITDVVATDGGTEVASRAEFVGMPTQSTFLGDTQYTGSSKGANEGGGIQERAIEELDSLDEGRLSWQHLNRQ